MFARRIIRRFSFTTVAGVGAFLAGAAEAEAQGKASEAAVVRVEVVAAPAAPDVRSADAGWAVTEAGRATWRAAVAVGDDAVLSLANAGEDGVRASLVVRRHGAERIAEIQLVADPATRTEGAVKAELPVTLRIEH